MVDRNLINKLGLSNEEIEQEVNELFTSEHTLLLEEELAKNVESLTPGSIVSGRIVTQLGDNPTGNDGAGGKGFDFLCQFFFEELRVFGGEKFVDFLLDLFIGKTKLTDEVSIYHYKISCGVCF